MGAPGQSDTSALCDACADDLGSGAVEQKATRSAKESLAKLQQSTGQVPATEVGTERASTEIMYTIQMLEVGWQQEFV